MLTKWSEAIRAEVAGSVHRGVLEGMEASYSHGNIHG